MKDTDSEILEHYERMLLKKGSMERLMMGFSVTENARQLVRASILERNPGISPLELKKEVFLRFYRNYFPPSLLKKILNHIEKEKKG
ncbi:MAG: hypothetical protein JSU78_01600 [Deltaproteobacteria bacterium]|nr:MAG: hypothetical protein JSU78_01600 [Deltaproteobacteria bacterium]